MNKSTKFLLASVSPVALAAGWAVLDSAPAHATVTVAAQNVTYASENFIGASAANQVTLTANPFNVATIGAGTTTDFVAGFVTFTLSNSATFTAVPAPASTGGVSLTSGSLVTGSTAVVYTVSSGQTTTVAAITLGNFSISNVGTRLATSNQNITLTYSSTGSSVPAQASGTIAVGAQAYAFAATVSDNTIDIANSGAGLVFRNSGGTSNVTFAHLGTLSQGNVVSARDIGGSTAFSTTASDVLRATITGNLSSFSSVYAATAICSATVPSAAVTGTIATGSASATFSGLVINSNYNICAIANGTSIVPSGTITGSASVTFAARTVGAITYTPGAYAQSASTVSTLTYNGSSNTAFYVVGLGTYTSAIRLTNPSSSAGTIFVQVTPDSTGTPVRALLDSTLAAGQSKFYTANDIRAAVGTSVLTDSNNRATVVFLSTLPAANFQVQNFMVNPGGTVSLGTSVQSGNTTGN
jgi:hypothetical protein